MMMYGYGNGMGWLGMGLGMIIHLAFTALIIMAVVWLFKALFRSGLPVQNQSGAVEILRQRFAKGELTSDEFQRMKKELE